MNNIKDLIVSYTTKLKNTIITLNEENEKLRQQIKDITELIEENDRLKQQIKEYDEMTNFITDYFNKLDIDSPKTETKESDIIPVFTWTPVTGNTMIIPDTGDKSKDNTSKLILNSNYNFIELTDKPVNKPVRLISKSKNYFNKRHANKMNRKVPYNSESDSDKDIPIPKKLFDNPDTEKKLDTIKKLFDNDFKFFFPKK